MVDSDDPDAVVLGGYPNCRMEFCLTNAALSSCLDFSNIRIMVYTYVWMG